MNFFQCYILLEKCGILYILCFVMFSKFRICFNLSHSYVACNTVPNVLLASIYLKVYFFFTVPND